jgi:hypothetical protein
MNDIEKEIAPFLQSHGFYWNYVVGVFMNSYKNCSIKVLDENYKIIIIGHIPEEYFTQSHVIYELIGYLFHNKIIGN